LPQLGFSGNSRPSRDSESLAARAGATSQARAAAASRLRLRLLRPMIGSGSGSGPTWGCRCAGARTRPIDSDYSGYYHDDCEWPALGLPVRIVAAAMMMYYPGPESRCRGQWWSAQGWPDRWVCGSL